MYPAEYRYTKEHQWIQLDGSTATIGITDYAQQELGDIISVELPKTRRPNQSRPVPRHRRIRESCQ